MNLFTHIFHKHSFNPKHWKEAGSVEIYKDSNSQWFFHINEKDLPQKQATEIRTTYVNTCVDCGILVSKTIFLK